MALQPSGNLKIKKSGRQYARESGSWDGISGMDV